MNTIEHVPSGRSGAAANVKGQTPVEIFEFHARAVWHSDLPADEKALKLYSLSDSISKYLRKAQIEIAERARSQDPWAQLSCSRATAYLERLSEDLRRLAIECQRKGVGNA